jgi:hypothetical protein
MAAAVRGARAAGGTGLVVEGVLRAATAAGAVEPALCDLG